MKLKQTFFALLVTFILSVSFYAQDWSLPKDNTPKEVITWATPLSFVKNSEYPFHGTISYYNYLGERKQRRDDKTGSYILRIPNKFKGNGLSKTGYTHFKVTWAVGEPDVNAGYTETKISWLSDWQQRAENPILSYQTDYDVGTVTFLNDVIINGSVAFPKGYTRTVGDSGIGHSCYSELKEEGISSNCFSGRVQYVYNSDTDLYYQFVRAADNSNALILWGIFSHSYRYKN